MYRRHFLAAAMILIRSMTRPAAQAARPLTISWEKNYLTIRGDFPGNEISILYLEAYCRPGSTDREWGQTVIKHTTRLVSTREDGRVIKLQDELADGVVVDHTITAGVDEIDFQLVARNPTARASEAHWAQPCLRVDRFTGMPTQRCARPAAAVHQTVLPLHRRAADAVTDHAVGRQSTLHTGSGVCAEAGRSERREPSPSERARAVQRAVRLLFRR